MKKTLIILLMLTAVCSTTVTGQTPREKSRSKNIKQHCVQPPFLKAGDRVALLSPSYSVPMEDVKKAADVLRGWGFEPVLSPNVDKIYAGKYAGTAAQRVSDLRWALSDTTIKAIICNRGGYGTIQYINAISINEWQAHPKWLVGFSDITTLHGLLTSAGVMSIHGTMGKFLAHGGDDTSSLLMRNLLTGQVPHYEVPPHPQNIQGAASGILVGGNLCTLAPNLGSQADASRGEDLILFLEEVEEPMRNIDRQFNALMLNGVLDRCKGVVLGEFTDCEQEMTFESVEAMLCQYLKGRNIPVMCGFPAGHDKVNLPLIMGARVKLDVRSDGATLEFDIDGKQCSVNVSSLPPTQP